MILRELLIEPFEDGDYGFGILIWIVFLPILAGVIALSLWLIDSSFLPVHKSKGIVESRQYNESYTYITYVHAGKVNVPITNRAPERYSLNISIDGIVDNFTVTPDVYVKFERGGSVQCEYTKGRIFNTIYIQSIWYK